jgi:hypothetical protein
MSEEVTSITGVKTMTALNPAGARSIKAKAKVDNVKKSVAQTMKTSVKKEAPKPAAAPMPTIEEQMRTSRYIKEELSPNKANQDLLYKDTMPEMEMRRSHYLMSKIAGRTGKDGYPIASEQHHGTAHMYIGNLSPKKEYNLNESDDLPAPVTWDQDTGVFPRQGETNIQTKQP